jgi:hypothetical protein
MELVELDTEISWGYVALMDTFATANILELTFKKRTQTEPAREFITIVYERNSETSSTLTFMAIRHSGIENMLCDFLMKCEVDPIMIPIGRFDMRKTDEELEEAWQHRRRELGFRK